MIYTIIQTIEVLTNSHLVRESSPFLSRGMVENRGFATILLNCYRQMDGRIDEYRDEYRDEYSIYFIL